MNRRGAIAVSYPAPERSLRDNTLADLNVGYESIVGVLEERGDLHRAGAVAGEADVADGLSLLQGADVGAGHVEIGGHTGGGQLVRAAREFDLGD